MLDYTRFSSVLRYARGYMTQKELAKKIGVPQSVISAWENGQRFPNLKKFVDICNYFKLDADEFLGLYSEDSVFPF